MLFIRNFDQPKVRSATQATEINTLDQIAGNVIEEHPTRI